MPNVCVYPTKDCCINRNATGTNYNGSYLWMDCLYVGSPPAKTQQMRALMQFTIPAEVNAGEFYKGILCFGDMISAYGSATARAYRVTQAGWLESEATWNSYKVGSAWAAAGGDYDATEYAAVTMPAANVNWFEIDITAMVTDAITNHSRSLDLIFILDDENPLTSIQFRWRSKDQAATLDWHLRPFLNIVRPPFGLPMQV